MAEKIITSGCFDDIRSKEIRFLYEISRYGDVHFFLFDDELVKTIRGSEPKFPLEERQYFLESVRYIEKVHIVSDFSCLQDIKSLIGGEANFWYVLSTEDSSRLKEISEAQDIPYKEIKDNQLNGFPEVGIERNPENKKVLVTGCFDWFHTGHIRFFEEASEYGDVYVVVGHDKNIEALKGPGHPMFSQYERKFIASSIQFVTQALISTGNGWLDAEPEIRTIKPDIYLVNEDGDKEEKRRFCEDKGIEYVVLKRTPKPGLQARTSTNLRGFWNLSHR